MDILPKFDGKKCLIINGNPLKPPSNTMNCHNAQKVENGANLERRKRNISSYTNGSDFDVSTTFYPIDMAEASKPYKDFEWLEKSYRYNFLSLVLGDNRSSLLSNIWTIFQAVFFQVFNSSFMLSS